MRRRLKVAALLLVAGCVVEVMASSKPLLVWNVTASAPRGLWRRTSGAAERGAWVLVRMPDAVAALASSRHYLPRNVPMVKRIAAISGDTVCRHGTVITVNGVFGASALARDGEGRPLPVWHGCQRLSAGVVFLLTAPSLSFDSRYFGSVSRANLIERITPLWTF